MKNIVAAISNVTLAGAIAVGAMLLWAGLVQVGKVVLQSARSMRDFESRHISFDDDGQPLIRVQKRTGGVVETTYTDLAGLRRERPTSNGSHYRLYLDAFAVVPPSIWMTSDIHLHRVRLLAESYDPTENWYVVHGTEDGGTCWLECYELGVPGRLLCLGETGTSESPPVPADRFQLTPIDNVLGRRQCQLYNGQMRYGSSLSPGFILLACDDGIRLVDLANRTSRVMATMPSDFVGMAVGRSNSDEPPSSLAQRGFDPAEWQIMIRTTSSLICMDANGRQWMTLAIPEEHQNHRLNLIENFDGTMLLYAKSQQIIYDASHDQGSFYDVTRTGELKNRRGYAWKDPYSGLSELADSCCTSLAVPMPVFVAGEAFGSSLTGQPWSQKLFWPRLITSLLSGGLAVLLCLRHQKEQTVSHRIFWIVFVALFGIFGFIGYRFHRHWPSFAATRPFAAKPTTGLEVFAE